MRLFDVLEHVVADWFSLIQNNSVKKDYTSYARVHGYPLAMYQRQEEEDAKKVLGNTKALMSKGSDELPSCCTAAFTLSQQKIYPRSEHI